MSPRGEPMALLLTESQFSVHHRVTGFELPGELARYFHVLDGVCLRVR